MATTQYVLAILLLAATATAGTAETLAVDGQTRSFTLHVPAAVAAAKRPVPAVFVLHGGRGSGEKVRASLGMDAVADRNGFVAVYPDGVSNQWNDGRPEAGRVDDVKYLSALADSLVKRGLVQPGRIGVTGLSNGGMMTMRLACETNGVFAAYASVIANLPAALAKTCQPKAAVPIKLMMSTADPLMPFGGGTIPGGMGGQVIAADQTFAHWSNVNGCRGTSPVQPLPDRDVRDGSRPERLAAQACRSGSEVVYVRLVGAGHQAPSLTASNRFLVDRFLGKANHDLEASEEIWRFFGRYLN